MANITFTKAANGNIAVTTVVDGTTIVQSIPASKLERISGEGNVIIIDVKTDIYINVVRDTITIGEVTYNPNSKTMLEMMALINASTVFQAANGSGDTISGTNTPFGFATLGSGTTGGGNATPVLITSLAELIASNISSSTPKVLYISGDILGTGTGQSGEFFNIGSNTTMLGINGARFTNIPFRIYASTSNVIIQNIRFQDVQQGVIDGDCIGIKESNNVFINHCEFSADRFHNDNQEYYDGLVDVGDQSNNVTIANCKFMDSNKACLIGGTNVNNAGFNRVTMAYNLFQNCTERSPRVQIGTAHIYNNYHVAGRSIPSENNSNNGYSSVATHGGVLRADNNYYANCNEPIADNLPSVANGQIANFSSNFFDDKCGASSVVNTASTYDPEVLGLYSYKSKLLATVDVPKYVLRNAGATLNLSFPE